MVESGGDLSTPTRRAVLGGVAGAAATTRVPLATADSHDPDAHDLRVMTRNLYVGVDLFRLAVAEDLDDVRRIAGALLAEARSHPYGARVDALAAEVAASEPAVLGVQEAALIRTREPSEFDGDHDPGASDVLVDLLAELEGALAARGLEYERVASTVTNDIEVPAATGDGDVDVRITDRTALLVRDDIAVEDARADRFEATVPIPLADTELRLRRGFCRVDLAVDADPATVATAHLEAFDGSARRRQAEELLGRLPGDRPVVLAGDINSGPDSGSGAYDALTESFVDAAAAVAPDAASATCCYDADLRDDAGALSSRVDVVLHRGRLRPTGIELVGVDPGERVVVEQGGETVRLWPSDHAGVVASFRLGTESATGAETPARTSPGTTSSTPTDPGPGNRQSEAQSGFGFLAALVGAVAAAMERRRRRD